MTSISQVIDCAEQQNEFALIRPNGSIQVTQKQNHQELDLLTAGNKRVAPPRSQAADLSLADGADGTFVSIASATRSGERDKISLIKESTLRSL